MTTHTSTTSRFHGRRGLDRKRVRNLWAYAFVLPQLLLVGAFTLYPIVMTHVYSLYEWPGFGPLDRFVGMRNYTRVIGDELFWNAFQKSFLFMAGTVALQLPLALFIAILLNSERLLGRNIYRTLFFIPVVTTSAVIGVVMRSIFASHDGLVNNGLQLVGLIDRPIRWLAQGDTAMLALILVASWKWLGIKMIMWLAGLQSLPAELYDAAKVDGANYWQTFRYITVPLLIPIGMVVLLFSIVDALTAFDLIFTMTEGGPGFTTEFMELYIYRYAFTSFAGGLPQLGYASAAGVFFGVTVFLISLVLSLLARRASQRGR
jgi:ABC-type sugar transport system permease subunit